VLEKDMKATHWCSN